MPGFHHSVAVLPFRSAVAVAGENGNAGNVFPYIHRDEVTRTLIGCPPTAERQK